MCIRDRSLPGPSEKHDNGKGQQRDHGGTRHYNNAVNNNYVYNSNSSSGGADSVDIGTISKRKENISSDFPNDFVATHSVQEGPTNEFNKLHIVEE